MRAVIRYLPYLVELALLVYCLIDAIQTDEALVRNLPKTAWILIIILIPIVGPVAWLVLGRPNRDSRTRYQTQQQRWESIGRGGRRQKHESPRGPDDDPDFLKGI